MTGILNVLRFLGHLKTNDLCLVLLGNYYSTCSNKSSFYASPSYLNRMCCLAYRMCSLTTARKFYASYLNYFYILYLYYYYCYIILESKKKVEKKRWRLWRLSPKSNSIESQNKKSLGGSPPTLCVHTHRLGLF
jgi:hypothetical protein